MEEIIQLKDVSQHFKMGDSIVRALSHINLDIYAKELTALVGPSGSGKSTLLNVVGGLTKPTEGEVFIYNTNVTHYTEDQMCFFRRDHIGFIFQSFNLNSTLTALENVTMPLIFSRIPNKDREKMASEALDLVGLKDRKDHKPGQLSGGQQQRVSVARAIVNKPKIILCDEPTGNLDSKTGKEILELIKEMNRIHQITFIIVTHDSNVANQCQRRIWIQDGKICKDERN
ncbi:putative ABC transport system ATP-binding protein [Alkalibaculum bacchi]|uniref:Putative ABC transport system ATP-binding protein n=1 Tax=Alkalibaculum bacchi TaxID=645887 RepID=A0A366I5Q7_9FIRM|nr:ABC transporter ATP-binding protein [Alkalibaculum bacchi]RBP62069.1 putative ABC transport system ATP-binding protein [Alkalibaculum bacchi]